MSNFISKI